MKRDYTVVLKETREYTTTIKAKSREAAASYAEENKDILSWDYGSQDTEIRAFEEE